MVTLSWYALTCEANSDETGHFEKKNQDTCENFRTAMKFQEFQDTF